jgi:hypothetical protein
MAPVVVAARVGGVGNAVVLVAVGKEGEEVVVVEGRVVGEGGERGGEGDIKGERGGEGGGGGRFLTLFVFSVQENDR